MSLALQVQAHEQANKMSAHNLAIVFGPNLLWSNDKVERKGVGNLSILAEINCINSFVQLMIVHKRHDVVSSCWSS